MVAKGNSITRKFVGTHSQEVCELPNLVGIQLDCFILWIGFRLLG